MSAGDGAMAKWPFACRSNALDEMEAELAGRGRGLVITGDAGIGKSRVLIELCDRLEAAGSTVHRIGATASLSTVPYGALASVLSGRQRRGDDEFTILQRALAELRGDRPPGATVIALDDAHLLDRGSATLALLAARAGMVVAATVRHGEPCPEGITALWRDDLAVRVDLPPLDLEQVGELLALVLGAPVDARTRYRLWDVTKGNLLFLRELVRAGLARGALAEHHDVWIWTGGFEGADRLHDLLRDKVESLPPDALRVVELLAIGEPMDAAVICELTPSGALEEAERAGMVVVNRSYRRLEARLVHPIYAQVVQASLGSVRTESLAQLLADAMANRGLRRANDELRIASLQLKAGRAADPDVLLKAARQARQYADIDVAEALARQAFAIGGSAAAAVTLAEVLYWQGRHDAVVELLTGGILDEAPAQQIAFGTIHLAGALFYGLGRLADSEEWLARAIARVGVPYDADLLAAHAKMLMAAGRAIESIDEAEAVLDRADASARARLNAYIALFSSLAMCGRFHAVDEHRTVALDLAATAGRGMPTGTGGIVIGLFVASMLGGRLAEFDPVLMSFNDEASHREEDPFRGVWTFLLGRSALAQGRLADAIPALREAAALLRLRDPGMMLPWCLAALTQAFGASDAARAARATLDELETVRFDVTRNIEVELELAQAWTVAAEGNRTGACEVALTAARRMQADGRGAVAAMAYHDALRLGAAPDAVAGPLSELAANVEGAVVPAMAAHANALARGDGPALSDAADRFESVGMMLHAAEAAAGATVLAVEAGLRASAGELRVRASSLASRCGPALTPLLEPISDRAALSRLTRKEQEVALMAARGMTKRDIADSLTVSVRTVGNHINHLYMKLGIGSRAELRALLHVDPEPPTH